MHTSKRMHFIEDLPLILRETTSTDLHTSKRMHFIEDSPGVKPNARLNPLHTSKRMHFIEERSQSALCQVRHSCIRQNVCTSLRSVSARADTGLPTSCIRQNVCTSLRNVRRELDDLAVQLAYVKTYALH